MGTNRYTITRVETWVEHLELTKPYTIAYKTVESVENVFVRIESGDGTIGLGAGSPAAFVTGETSEACVAALEANAEALMKGRDVRQMQVICRELFARMPETPAARTAIDLALHDLLGRLMDAPVVSLLGRAHRALPTSVTIGIKGPEETAVEGKEYRQQGFRIIKLKIGKDLEQDIATTRLLREAVGKEMGIRVDANQGYTAADLVRYAKETADCDIELIEQPLPEDRSADMLEAPEALRRICAADESLKIPADALTLAPRPQSYGIYNIKLMKCGGIVPAMEIGTIARLAGIELMWGCMDESIISITGALHAALASPATRYLDLDGSFDLERDLVKGGFILKEGMLSVSDDLPGLGVELL